MLAGGGGSRSTLLCKGLISQPHHNRHHQSHHHLGLLHGVEIEVEALEVYEEMVREELDGTPLFRVQSHRLALAFVLTISEFPRSEGKTMGGGGKQEDGSLHVALQGDTWSWEYQDPTGKGTRQPSCNTRLLNAKHPLIHRHLGL